MVVGRQIANGPESFKRLAALIAASLLLCLSVVMSFFTSLPAAFACVTYGRKKGYAAVVVAWIASFALSFLVLKQPMMFATYTGSVLVTVAIVEVALRNVSPMRGIVASGLILIALLFGVLFASFQAAQTTPKKFVVDQVEVFSKQFEENLKKNSVQNSSEVFELKAMLNKPEKLAEEILAVAPGYIASGIFVTLWANLFILLKLKRTVLGRRDPYTDWDLIQYKNPDHLVWAVAACLALSAFGDQVGPAAEKVGLVGLMILGTFYFFQGFGLYISFLNFMRLRGFLRAILVIATVITAYEALAIIGLFDMFVNFRRFMKKKDQGE